LEKYESILGWMLTQLPMYQKKGAQAYRPDLSRMEKFCNHLQQPQKKFKSIHIAGTNGKGSTAHMMASILQQHGYKVGLYTSPHLKDFRERIKINGALIEKDFVVDFVERLRSYLEDHKLSFFEMTVGLAFSYFSKRDLDIAVIEVGMGGRLDGTNLIMPELSVITNIGMDHTQFLGNSLQAIAGEKAGIIKSRAPVVIGTTQVETQAVFREKAKALKAPIIFADQTEAMEYESDLKGNYQRHNIQTALVGLQHLKGFELHPKTIEKGLMNVVDNTGLKGRWQVMGDAPMIVADVAHNKEGLQYILPQIESHSYRQLHLVMGFVNDKAVDEILRLFPQNAQYYFSAPQIPRALAVADLEPMVKRLGIPYQIFPSVESAFLAAQGQAHADDFIFVGGSTFVVAEIL